MPIPDDRDKFSTFWFSEIDALALLKLDDEKFSESSPNRAFGRWLPDLEITSDEASVCWIEHDIL